MIGMTTLSLGKLIALSGSLMVLILGGLLVTRSDRAVVPQDDQQLEVKSAKWQPGSGDLKSLAVLGHSLSDVDVRKLRALELKGSVLPAGSGTYGTGPRNASVLIVIQHPLQQPTTLAQPDGTNLIYIQTDDGWRMYPSDAKTLQRKIRLAPDPRQPGFATLYMVEHIDGSSQGGTLVTW